MSRTSALLLAGAAVALVSQSLFAAITAKSYVSDGLVALWDAKENTGYGVFNADATSWTDLSGKAFSIPKSGSSQFTGDEFTVEHATGPSVASATLAATDLFAAYKNGSFTAEIAYDQTEATPKSGTYNVPIGVMMMVGSYDVFVGIYGDNTVGFNSTSKKGSASLALGVNVGANGTMGQHTYSCRQDGANWKVDFDGAKSAKGSDAGATGTLASTYGFYLNRTLYSAFGFTGGFHAIRFYKRPLSDDEVAVNRAVDQVRYFEADPASCALPTGWRFTTGDDIKLEREATIAPKDGVGGKISVNGGDWTEDASLWLEQGVGATVAVKAVADEGYVFQGWSGAVEGEDLTLAETTVTVKGDVLAVFRKTDGSDPRTYSLVGTTGDWDDPAAWTDEFGFKGVPQTGDSAVVAAGKTLSIVGETAEIASLTVAGTVTMTSWTNCLKATDVTVPNGGVITCGPASRDMEGMSRVWIACENLTVATGGKIDVAKKGFLGKTDTAGAGPGASKHLTNTAPSHGGFGAVCQISTTASYKPSMPYDDPEAPELPGSSGRATSFNASRKACGGGAVRIAATGLVTVDGLIDANGDDSDHSGSNPAATWSGQSGAGGSIYVTCQAFAGSGQVRANGGSGEWPDFNPSCGLAAGGGCIAIHYDAEAQKAVSVEGLRISAAAGKYKLGGDASSNVNDLDDDKWCQADMGTLHFTDDQIVRALIGKGLTGQIRGLSSFVWDGDLSLTSGRVRFATEGVAVTVNGNLTLAGGDTRLEIGGCTATNWTHHTVLYSGTAPCSLTVTGDLTLEEPSRLDVRSAATEAYSDFGAFVTVGGTLTVAANSRVYAWSDPMTLGSPSFTVGGLDVQEGALFSADCRGGRGAFNSAVSAYTGSTGAKGPSCGSFGSGAGHGGKGGKGGTAGYRTGGGGVCDNAVLGRPVMPGSGGSCYSNNNSGNGGGRIQVSAPGGTIQIDGTVTACGEDGNIYGPGKDGAGGAGGTILLEAKTFACGATGLLKADGGSVTMGSSIRPGAGGGGRIAVWCGDSWSADVRKSRITVSETPLGTDYAEFFSWAGVMPSVDPGAVNGDQPDSHGDPGTVHFCFVRPKTGMLMLVR